MNRTSQATKILRMMDPSARKLRIGICLLLIAVAFLAHCLANNWESPLALLPRTFTGIIIGILVYQAMSLKKFPVIMEYLDKERLIKDAESTIDSSS